MRRFVLTLVTLAVTAFAAGAQEVLAADDLDATYATDLVKPGEMAPPFTMKDLSGQEHSPLGEFPGKWIVLDFWASWCRDCRADMPRMMELHAKADPQKVVFVGVSFDTSAEAMQKYLDDKEIPWLQVTDLVRMNESAVAKAYGIHWIPSVCLIGPDGKVVLSTVMVEKLAATLEEIK